MAFKSTLKMHILVFIMCKKLVRNGEQSKRDLLSHCSIREGINNSLSQSENAVLRSQEHDQRLTDCLAQAHLQKIQWKNKNKLRQLSENRLFPFHSQQKLTLQLKLLLSSCPDPLGAQESLSAAGTLLF